MDMKILVSNIGSTSFKFRLFQIAGKRDSELASGSADRIGQAGGVLKLQLAGKPVTTSRAEFADHEAAIRSVLDSLTEAGVLDRAGGLDGVAFKAVVGGELPAVTKVDEKVLAEMERLAPVGPAHNPPYVAAMRMFAKVLPDVPRVACFEMGFHRTNPPRRRAYAVPPTWAEHGVRRYGYHGASHRYIAGRDGPAPEGCAADHQLPPGRLEQPVRDSRRAIGRHQHGPVAAIRPAAEHPRGRLGRLRHQADDGPDRTEPSTTCWRSWAAAGAWRP